MKLNKFLFLLLLIILFAILFISIYFLIPTYATGETKSEMKDIGSRLQTAWSIHNYVVQNNNYTIGFYPRNINNYWEDRIGDCTEIARTEQIMLRGAGIKSQIKTGYLNGNKHHYTVIDGEIAFDKETVPFVTYWYQKIMKYNTNATSPIT